MPTIGATLGNGSPALSLAMVVHFAVPVAAFYIFIAFCLSGLVNAFEEISLSLAKIAAKPKDEGRI